MWTNYHMHTHYCDGVGVFEDYIEQARLLQIPFLGFSSHGPVPFDCKWCMKKEDFTPYIKELESLQRSQSGIEVYRGLEADYIPGVISPLNFREQLDFTVGSIHFVETLPDGRPWEIDNTYQVFLEGFEKIFSRNIQDLIHRYYELTREMIQKACPDVVGHMDKIKIQNKDGQHFKESDAWYRQEVKQTLDTIARSPAVVEVNTRGLYQKKSTTPYPSPWVLELIHQKNIPITLSSDAHHPKDIINQFAETASLLSGIGFKHIHILKEGRWQPVPFNQHGIIQ